MWGIGIMLLILLFSWLFKLESTEEEATLNYTPVR